MLGTQMARRVLHSLVEAATIMGQQILCLSSDAGNLGSNFLRLIDALRSVATTLRKSDSHKDLAGKPL